MPRHQTILAVTIAGLALLLLLGSTLAPTQARSTGINDVAMGCICHSGSPAEDVQVTLNGVPANYSAGDTVILTINISGGPEVTNGSINQGGFNLVVDAGTLSTVGDDTQILEGEATHTHAGNDQREWQVEWTAPADQRLEVTFTLHGNSVNGDGAPNGLDHWNKTVETSVGIEFGQEDDKTPGFTIAGLIAVLAISAIARSQFSAGGRIRTYEPLRTGT